MTTRTPGSRAAPMHERIEARRRDVRAQRARRRRRIAVSILWVSVLAGLGAVAVASPLFAVTELRVSGVDAARAETVLAVSGLREGENLLLADLAAARAGVGALAWVRDVEVRRLPPSVVLIRVARREAVAVLATGESLWLVDAEGVVLEGGTRAGLPVVAAGPDTVARVGEFVEDGAVRNALAVHTALPGPLRSLVVRYDAPSVPGLRVLLDAGEETEGAEQVWVRFGAAERVDAKARVIGLLLAQARDRPTAAAELDVRAPDNPVLVPTGGTDRTDGGGA